MLSACVRRGVGTVGGARMMGRAAAAAVGRSVAMSVGGVRGAKTSTGLVGLPVDPHGRDTLLRMSQQVLDSVQRIPPHTEYRKAIDKWFKFIKGTCEKHAEISAIEAEIDLGQIEEVIEMCKNELEVIDMYHENKVWEIVEREKEFIQQHIQEIKDSLYYTDPAAHEAAAAPPQGQPPK